MWLFVLYNMRVGVTYGAEYGSTSVVVMLHLLHGHTYIAVLIRVWINRVRSPILIVVSWTGKINISLSAFAPENLVSRDGFGSPAPRQPAHLSILTIQAEFGACLRDSSRVSRWRPFIIYHRVSPEFIGSRNCVPMTLTAESPPAQGQ